MQLTPVYGEAPVVTADPFVADPGGPLVRQRARLSETLADLDNAQWAAPSRCEGWSVHDVVTHLESTNGFWAASITAGLAGRPTRFLATFDPVSSPAQLVEAARPASTDETLARFVRSSAALADAVDAVDGRWGVLGEAPPGHVPLALVAQHALWDSWVHERDIVLPLGIEPVEASDEVDVTVRYAAALSPAFLASQGSIRSASVEFRVTDPEARFVVDVGPQVVVRDTASASDVDSDRIVVEGDAVRLIEALSMRAAFPDPVAPEHRWLLGGLAAVFDQDDRTSS